MADTDLYASKKRLVLSIQFNQNDIGQKFEQNSNVDFINISSSSAKNDSSDKIQEEPAQAEEVNADYVANSISIQEAPRGDEPADDSIANFADHSGNVTNDAFDLSEILSDTSSSCNEVCLVFCQ